MVQMPISFMLRMPLDLRDRKVFPSMDLLIWGWCSLAIFKTWEIETSLLWYGHEAIGDRQIEEIGDRS